MNARAYLLFSLLLLGVPDVRSQVTIETRTGENVLILELYNRTQEAFPNLQLRFASSQAEWFAPRGRALGSLGAFYAEQTLRRNRLQFKLPFAIAESGYANTPITLELLNNENIIGTFDLFLSFDETLGKTASLSSWKESDSVSIDARKVAIPEEFSLSQNYPNPFNPTTNIRFDLPAGGHVSLKLFDLLGQEVRTLVNGERHAGYHAIAWDGKNNEGANVPSGVYIYRMVSSNFVQTHKMMLIR